MRWFYKLRVWFKSWVKQIIPMDSYCDDCGRAVHDFSVDDETWLKVCGGEGGVVCYDCFCESCRQAGVFPVWRLAPLTDAYAMAVRYRRGESVESLAECFGVTEGEVLDAIRDEGKGGVVLDR